MTSSLNRRALMLASVASAVASICPARADEAILTVRGLIAAPGERIFTLAELEAQPRLAFRTQTPWHSGPVAFEGIGLDALLDLVGATGTKLRLIALNDYVVDADIAELKGRGGLFAYRENGRDMPIDDKGPLFLVFPFDGDPTLRHQSIYARCVWQLSAIEIA